MRSFIPVLLAAALMTAAATPSPALAQETIYMVSYIDLAPGAKEQAAALLRPLAEASRKDAGVMGFEVLQRTVPAHQFVILATWKDQPSLDAHAASAHSKDFRNRLAPLLIAPVDDRLCIVTYIGTQTPAAGSVHVVTHVDVPGAQRDKLMPGLAALAERSRKEPGNLRFDVVHQKTRTNHFTVIEVWKDQKANDTHELATHTREFRDLLTPITGALYDQRWYRAM